MKQWIQIGMAACALVCACGAGAAAPQQEAAVVGAWQQGLTPQMAGWNDKQLQMAKTSGVLGGIVQYNADHSFIMHPPCGPKRDALRKAGVQAIKGTWELTDAGHLVSQVEGAGKLLKIDTTLTWQDGQMVLLNANGSVAQKAGRYTGTLPPAC